MLEVPVQRDECCQAGGSLEFGPDGNLFLSIGDNTNPFNSNGFAPIDERPLRTAWDARRSSSNTNDLRGKILRIKPKKDGGYTIPEGNLFPPGTPDTRPEIYIMGCRNPFRISIDPKTKYLSFSFLQFHDRQHITSHCFFFHLGSISIKLSTQYLYIQGF